MGDRSIPILNPHALGIDQSQFQWWKQILIYVISLFHFFGHTYLPVQVPGSRDQTHAIFHLLNTKDCFRTWQTARQSSGTQIWDFHWNKLGRKYMFFFTELPEKKGSKSYSYWEPPHHQKRNALLRLKVNSQDVHVAS